MGSRDYAREMHAQIFQFPFLKKLFAGAAAEFSKDNVLRLSAALSYYSVFSIAPLLLIAVALAGKFFGAEAAQGKIEEQLTSVMGWQAAHALQALLQSASASSGKATFVGFAILLVGASGVFGQLKAALDSIWEVQPKSAGVIGFLREELLSFGMVLVIGFLLLVSLVLATIVAAFSGWLEQHLGLPKFVSALAAFVLPLIIEAVLFALIFKVLPSAEVQWHSVWIGASFTALFFELGKIGLSFYLARGSTTSSFGAAGSLVIILLWVYYGSLIMFFGAEITEVYARLSGHSIQPDKRAETTEKTCAAGSEPRPVRAAGAPAELHPLSEASEPPRAPSRESLTPLLVRTVLPDPMHARRAAEDVALSRTLPGKIRVWMRRANDHPVLELGAAVGVGLLAGVASRMLEKDR